MLEIGSMVDGKYLILDVVGKGGMSIVYLARNVRANKHWAVKELRKDGSEDFEVVKQGLVAEIDILKKLNHPYLPSIVDVLDSGDTFIIIMDYIEGNSLNKVLQEYGAQSQEKVVEWAKQLCDVLGYLHTRTPPIIYRDMKPSNVMLKPDGTITLIDFGTAREYKEKNLADTTSLGTAGYAAPEQYSGSGMGQTTERTDIYCLGRTIYHLVTGIAPPQASYVLNPITEANPELSTGLDKIIQKCTAYNVNDRYQNCAELMYDLENYKTIDEEYRKKQVNKVVPFFLSIVLFIVFLTAGVTFNRVAKSNAQGEYESIINLAENEIDLDKKQELLLSCIDVPNKAGDKTAYLELIDLYKAVRNDEESPRFTEEEKEEFISLVTNNKVELIKDETAYTQICFELGKLFWYYYDNDDRAITGPKSSVKWFNEINNDNYENNLTDKQRDMAQVYADIGSFYTARDYKVVEADDGGMYLPLFENMQQLISSVAVNPDEDEIVRFELLNLVASALSSDPTKFKQDGVSKEQLTDMVKQVQQISDEIIATTDKTAALAEQIKESLKNADEKIETAFSTKKESDE